MTEYDLRLGAWEKVLATVEDVDTLIGDYPYGERTHDDESLAKQVVSATGQSTRSRIEYDHWTPADVHSFVHSWRNRVKGWWVSMTSHDLIPAWEQAYESIGLYSFAPLAYVVKNARLIGDGPASWLNYIMVARPRNQTFSRWGCLPGTYGPGKREATLVTGGKPLWLMKALVRDYSRKGDLICDPCAGGATTLAAALAEGRRAIGAEVDPETYDKALKRLQGGTQPDMFSL